MNITISVPLGTITHGDSNFLCIPPQWYDYVVFLATNYLAHAITVISLPGQTPRQSAWVATMALLIPASGISRAVEASSSRAVFSRDPIERAVRAGALCMVVRAGGRPVSRDKASHRDKAWYDRPSHGLFNRQAPGLAARKIQGIYQLQDGWDLVQVPNSVPVSMLKDTKYSHAHLSTPYNVPKLLVGLVQAIWASVTLYRARGTQIEKCGYAAFGLTVAQYAYMSVINVISSILSPEFPAMFIIRTPGMYEAESEGCFFSGDLKVELGDGQSPSTFNYLTPESIYLTKRLLMVGICGAFGAIPLVIVGALSGFKAQHSTVLQRVFTMWWLVSSLWVGPALSWILVEGRDHGIPPFRKAPPRSGAYCTTIHYILSLTLFANVLCRSLGPSW